MNPTPFCLWPLVEQVLLRSPDTIHLGVKRITRSPTQITGGFWFVLIVRLVLLFSLGFCLTSPSWGAEVFAGCGRQHHFLVAGIFSAPVPSFHPKEFSVCESLSSSLLQYLSFFLVKNIKYPLIPLLKKPSSPPWPHSFLIFFTSRALFPCITIATYSQVYPWPCYHWQLDCNFLCSVL